MNVPVSIVTIPARTLVGIKKELSLSNYDVAVLWQQFMPRRKEITNTTSNDLYSLAIYPANYFDVFDQTKLFTRAACMEVSKVDHIPDGFEQFNIPESLYAVFQYKGSNTSNEIFEYIYGTWIPSSGYRLDDRPHFEILGEKYKNGSSDSEEEIWIPVIRE